MWRFFCMFFAFALVSVLADVKEPSTSHQYSSIYKNKKKELDIAGVGVRVKQIGPIQAKVYSAALYLDKLLTTAHCKDFGCKDAADLLKSPDFIKYLTSSDKAPAKPGEKIREIPDRTVQLTMYRNVAGYTMVNALSTAIKPKMGGKDEKILEEFEKVLTSGMHKHGDAISKNMVLSFNVVGSKISVLMEGEQQGEVDSPVLAKAFLETYLGKDTVSPTLKTDVAKNVFSWLKSSP